MGQLDDDTEESSNAELLRALAWTPEIAPFRGTDRYRVHACLGEGGFGVVYEVEDVVHARRLALKTLKPLRTGFAANIQRLKHEFRSVADLAHPNLVGLHELESHESRWFFTMELVRGCNFRDYVAACSEARARAALAQLVAGVTALHHAGIIHRDLKPSNVLVESGGRVVILDFGLANSADPALSDAGTPTFMAPEQASGNVVTAAADWYSVGVMLYEAFSGCFPGGTPARRMPADLERLCTELLRPRPEQRPTTAQIHAMLGQAIEIRAAETCFVGRARELATLEQAYARIAEGPLVRIQGQSGVGKSALIERFCDRLGDEPVVLAGRCHEREAVPFKALDGVIDVLVGHLKSLPRHKAAALMPRDIALVTQLFPVLGSVDAVHDVPARAGASADPYEARERSFAALKELFARIGDSGPLVIAIDDLQWSDIDSARLLVHLLSPPRPRMLLLLAYRSEDAERSPALRETVRLLEAAGASGTTLVVEPLDAREAEQLAATLVGSAGSDAHLIAERGEGHPLFISELARELAKSAHRAAAAPSLLDMLWQRVQRLSSSARAVVETLAVAGEPLPAALCCAAAGVGDDAFDAVRVLRAERLIRAGERGEINVFHDRVRDAVISRAEPAVRKRWHLALARKLEDVPNPDLETLARHFDAADEYELAARYALRAADAAIKSLAFDRAAALCRMAIERTPSLELYEKLGDALLHAGSDAEAGKAYLEAAERSTGAHATRLRGLAGQHMLDVGDVEAGYAAIERALAEVGETMPCDFRQSFREAIRHLVMMRLGGLRMRERDPSTISREDLLRLDVLGSAAKGLASANFGRGLGVMMRFTRLAFKVGDPRQASLGPSWVALTLGGATRPAKIDELLDQATALAMRVSDWNSVAHAMRVRAQSHWFYGNPQRAHALCKETSELIVERCIDMGETHRFVRMLSTLVDTRTGRLQRAQREANEQLIAAVERNDAVAARLVCVTSLVPLALADDDPDRAQYWFEHVPGEDRCAAILLAGEAAVSLAMYRGRPATAVEEMRSRSAQIAREGLLMPPEFRLIYVRSYVTALLAAGNTRGVARMLRSIRGFKFSQAIAITLSLRALVALRNGRSAKASALLAEAARHFDEATFVLDAAACRYRAAELAGDDARVAQAAATLRSYAIVSPERWVAMTLPAIASRRGLRSSPTLRGAA